MNPLIVTSAIQALPAIIAAFKAQHAAANPNDPPITDAQARAALLTAIASSLATDDAWDAAHPKVGGTVISDHIDQ